MTKSERLKAAAIASESLVATASGLRVPKAPRPSSEKELNELEKKSPAERATAAATKVKEAMQQQCERKEAADRFVKLFSSGLRRALKAGAVVDKALEDELLGVTPPEVAAKPVKDGALGYDGGAAAPSTKDDDDDDDSGTMDMQMMMAQMMSLSSSNSSGGGSGGSGGLGGTGSLYGSAYALKRDRLNLSGLLNVLDGVVDTPERIVSNRPPNARDTVRAAPPLLLMAPYMPLIFFARARW